MTVHLGLLTARPCPHCHRPLRLVAGVALCADRVHCAYSELEARHWQIVRQVLQAAS